MGRGGYVVYTLSVEDDPRILRSAVVQQQHDPQRAGLGQERPLVVELSEASIGQQPGGVGVRLEPIEVQQGVIGR
jgi:hypothetical protein